MYQHANITQYLAFYGRSNTGETTTDLLRYPDDPYDRLWKSLNNPVYYSPISTTATASSIQYSFDDQWQIPKAVIKTALEAINSTEILFHVIFEDTGMPNNQFYFVLHFMEFQPNTQRFFDLYFNNEVVCANYTPPYLLAGFIFNDVPFTSPEYYWGMNSSGLSSLPPIINGLEIYLPMYLTQLATNSSDSAAITAIKVQYEVKRNWVGDPCSPHEFAWNGLNCSYGSNVPRITSVNLSSSSLSGLISSYFSNLSALEYLDLSDNKLTGPVPPSLGTLSSLKILNLKCNNLTGKIPETLLERSQIGLLTISVDNTTHPCTHISEQAATKKKKIGTPIIVVISLVPALLLLGLVAFVVSRIRRRTVGPTKTPKTGLGTSPLIPPPFQMGCFTPESPTNSRGEAYDEQKPSSHLDAVILLQNQQQFTYAQLVQITNNFAKVIGQGGFGPVYLGYLQNGKQVAVKTRSQASSQGKKEFLAEAQNLTRIHHRNLVSLVGFCMEINYLALVYDYMPQGSLSDHLRGKGGNYKVLSWENRLQIAVDAAQGIEYLHKGCNPPLIHRDVKSSNILLGEELEAKIADFGLSRAFHIGDHSYVSTEAVVGTPGYLDPEYHRDYKLSCKSDIYSFGIVLLEIITGQPPLVQGKGHIIQWVAKNVERGNIEDIVDRNLRGEFDANSVWKVIDLAMKCTADYGSQRPTMSFVVTQLKESLELQIAHSNANKYSQNSYMSQESIFDVEQKATELGGGPSAR